MSRRAASSRCAPGGRSPSAPPGEDGHGEYCLVRTGFAGIGIFRQVVRPTYDDAARAQVSQEKASLADLQALLTGQDTWTV